MKTIIVTLTTLLLASTALAQPTSRTLTNDPLANKVRVASASDEPCTQELQEQRQELRQLILRLEQGEKVDPQALERLLDESH